MKCPRRLFVLRIVSEPEAVRVSLDGGVQPCALGRLRPELRHQPRHLRLEGLAVVFPRLRGYVAAGGQHVAVPTHLETKASSNFSAKDFGRGRR